MESQDEQRSSGNDAAARTEEIWLVFDGPDGTVLGFCQTEAAAKAAADHIGGHYEPCKLVKGCYTQYSLAKLPYGAGNQFSINKEYKFQEPLEEVINGVSYSASPAKAFERLFKDEE